MPIDEQSARLERIIERFQEDERLRGDLQDEAAKSLLDWAIEQISAAMPHGDAALQKAAHHVRQAAISAATSGLSEPAEIIAAANTALVGANEAGVLAMQAAPLVATDTGNDQDACS